MAAVVVEQQEWRLEEEEEDEPLIGRQNKTPTTYAEEAAMVMDASNVAGGGTFPTASYDLSGANGTNGEAETKTLLLEKNKVVASSSSSSSSSATSSSSVVENGSSSSVIIFSETRKEEVTEAILENVFSETTRKEEVTEVILENVYQKPATQEFVCPNCKACIKKVILQAVDDNTRQPTPLPPRPVHNTFRCTSCFSFLIPVGNWIFGGREQDDDELITDQVDVHVPQGTPSGPPAATTKAPLAGEVAVDHGKVPSAGPPTAEPMNSQGKAPQTSGSKPEKQPAFTEGAGQEENGGHVAVISRDPPTIGFPSGGWGDWRNKLQPPNQPEQAESGKVEVVVDDGQASTDATINDKKTGGRTGILGVIINKLPVIAAPQMGNMDNGTTAGVEDVQRPGIIFPVSTTNEAPAPVPESAYVLVPSEASAIPLSRGVDNGREWDILKSIVYGGLAELITSLSIVTSAASADADTLKIMAIGIANLVGGLSLLATNISDLRCEPPRRVIVSSDTQEEAEVDRYCDVLGRRTNFMRHAFCAVLSFLGFGLIPPVVYGFSFKESDNKVYKIAAVAAASLFCIVLLAIGKAHVQKPPKAYFKTLMFYLMIGFMASGISFAAGDLFKKVMDDLGWFKPVAKASPVAAAAIAGMVSGMPAAWGSS